MKNILVSGSNGQLGSELRVLEKDFLGYKFFFTDIEDLDLTDYKAVNDFFEENSIDVCINCAAYTAVDKAEDDRNLAMLLNCNVVDNLGHICARSNSLLIHISTDYVFDGRNFQPYRETDTPSPDSYYGKTKLKGEEAIMNQPCNSVIIRTSWLYSVFGNNFVSTMIRLGGERDNLGVVSDQVGTPTSAADLAMVIMKIVSAVGTNEIKEIYHYSNEGVISWYDFAKAIMSIKKLNCKVNAIESKDFPAKAPRPFYSVMNKSKIKEDFKIEIPYWLDSLKIMIENLK
jgi:dTDP-4-dehydrorhamnose reductase